MYRKETLILKLGGSIVTLKQAKRPALRRRHLQKIASTLKKHFDPQRYALILIHGAGSFGHLHAHTHDLKHGTKNHPEKLFRAVENQSLDAFLNSEITKEFIRAGLPVTGIPTRSIAINNQGTLKSLETKSIASALTAGAIPLLHGDMVFDTAWGLSICSGDTLAAELSKDFKVTKVFFASDVDGIFTKDPHRYKEAKLVQNTTFRHIQNGLLDLGQSHSVDVTGGLSQKFLLFKKHPHLENVFLFNGLDPKNFSFVFDQKNFFGTRIENKKR